MPPKAIARLRRLRRLAPLLRLGPVQSFLRRRIERGISGPSDERRAATDVQLWGCVESADQRRVTATMRTPNGYDLTVSASLALARHLLENGVEGGYYTPSLLMGPGFAERLEGVSLVLTS